jgi:L-threonylcarbamoyladenylate synthase
MLHTEIFYTESSAPDPNVIIAVGALLRTGRLVAFPTETVYGLGANALDAEAVARIFAAKGRPSNNPLIVHIADIDQIALVAADFPPAAKTLAERFWPGPLTLILPKSPNLPSITTAGGETVGVRIPAHPVARAIIAAAGIPVAAPSANRFTEVSPTTAAHVVKGLGGRIDAIVDAGPTSVGIESTVLDITRVPPTLWRAGMISQSELEAALGVRLAPAPVGDAVVASPGQHPRHYAPNAQVHLVAFGEASTGVDVLATLAAAGEAGPFGCLTMTPAPPTPGVIVKPMPTDPQNYAKKLYAALHEMENHGVTHLIIEDVPNDQAWAGIKDRLKRAGA